MGTLLALALAIAAAAATALAGTATALAGFASAAACPLGLCSAAPAGAGPGRAACLSTAGLVELPFLSGCALLSLVLPACLLSGRRSGSRCRSGGGCLAGAATLAAVLAGVPPAPAKGGTHRGLLAPGSGLLSLPRLRRPISGGRLCRHAGAAHLASFAPGGRSSGRLLLLGVLHCHLANHTHRRLACMRWGGRAAVAK